MVVSKLVIGRGPPCRKKYVLTENVWVLFAARVPRLLNLFPKYSFNHVTHVFKVVVSSMFNSTPTWGYDPV